jgi:hypothetical protein
MTPTPIRWKYQIGKCSDGPWEVRLRPWQKQEEALFIHKDVKECQDWIEEQEIAEGYANEGCMHR